MSHSRKSPNHKQRLLPCRVVVLVAQDRYLLELEELLPGRVVLVTRDIIRGAAPILMEDEVLLQYQQHTHE